MNAGKLGLLLAAGALVWALLLLRPGARTSVPAAEAARPTPGASSARATPRAATSAARPAADGARPQPGLAAQPAQPVTGPLAPASPDSAVDAETLARRKRLAVEQDRRHDRRFDTAVARWKQEPPEKREEPWAKQRELTLRAALDRDGLGQLLQRVECRATLCRVQLSAADAGFAYGLRRSMHFMRELGRESASAMAGEGAGRVLILFVPRSGMLTAPPPPGSPLTSPHPQ